MGKVAVPAVAVYPIADADSLGLANLPAAVEGLATAGADWIQVRIKKASDRQRWQTLERCCRRLEGSRSRLWVDDRVDLAMSLPCAGVHLGQRDLPAAAARRILPHDTWIGHSCHDLSQLTAAAEDEAVDVVALGPIFQTRSKTNADPEVGLDVLRRARQLTSKPLVAIGGVGEGQLPEVLATGVDQVAVIGALGRDVRQVEAKFRRLLKASEEVP